MLPLAQDSVLVTKQSPGHQGSHVSHGLLIIGQKGDYPSVQAENITDRIYLDVTYTREIPPPSTSPDWSGEDSPPGPTAVYTLYRERTGWRLDIGCQGKGTFLYYDNTIKVYWHPEGTGAAHYLFGIGLALWFELRGIPCLHGNSLVTGDHAIALLGPTQAGKSTLTAALLKQGCSFLTDDLVVPRETNRGWLVYPAPGPLRMWPTSIERFVTASDIDSLNHVHALSEKRLVPVEAIGQGNPCQTPKPLKTIYLLDRDHTQTNKAMHIETLKPADALVALIANSIVGAALKPIGVEQSRLNVLTKMISDIQVKSIHYPHGYQHLDDVMDLLIADALETKQP